MTHTISVVVFCTFITITLSFNTTEKQRGVNFLNGQWSPPKFDSQEAHESFFLVGKSGAEFLALTFAWYQWNIFSTKIYERPGVTPTDTQLAGIVNLYV